MFHARMFHARVPKWESEVYTLYSNSRFGDIGHVFSRSLFPLPRLRELVTLQVKKARTCGIAATSSSLDNPLSLQRLRRAPFPLPASSPPPGFARAETRALSNSLAFAYTCVRTFGRSDDEYGHSWRRTWEALPSRIAGGRWA